MVEIFDVEIESLGLVYISYYRVQSWRQKMRLENHLQPCVLEHPLSLCKKRFGNELY